MKNITSIGVILAYTLVGAVLIGDRFVMQASAEAEVTETNLVTSTDTNYPPVNTLLGSSLPEDIDPASPFGQLVRLVQAGVEQGVILAYIKSAPRFFELDADDIIYLTDLGTPAEVIEAIMAHDQELFDAGVQPAESQPAENTIVTEENPPEVTVDEFYDTLSPYGSWIYISGYGRCWRPTVVVYDASWRPYCDNGRWVYTDRGWYWMSNYSWGWATFHYGRWFRHARYGWCWWPDTVWAPSWVTWRYDTDYCGWAPLPPRTYYRSGVGLVYRGSVVSVGFGFNLNYSCFTYVSTRYFCYPNPRRYCVDRDRVAHIYRRTKGHCRYDTDKRSRTVINSGIPPTHISSVTQQDITPVSIRYNRNGNRRGGGIETLNRSGNSLVVNRYAASRARQPSANRNSSRNSINSNTRSSAQGGNSNARNGSVVNRRTDPGRAGNRSSVASSGSTSSRSATPSGTVTRRQQGQGRSSTVTPARPSTSRQNNNPNRGSERSNQVRQPRSTRPAPPQQTAPRSGQSGNNNRRTQVNRQNGAGTSARPATTSRSSTVTRPQTLAQQQRPSRPAPVAQSRSRQVPRNTVNRSAQTRVQSRPSRPAPAPQPNRGQGTQRSQTTPRQSRAQR